MFLRVSLEVEPSPRHPKFYDLGGAVLQVFLFDSDPESAAERAKKIAEQMHWEVKAVESVGSPKPGADENSDYLPEARQHVESIGAFFRLIAWRVGAE
jgi:hypothetical protein